MKKKEPELRSDEAARTDGDEARKRILARRASFVAAALAGVSTACGKEPSPPPQPCLSQVKAVDDAAAPQPCLEVPPPPVATDGGSPEPCLRIIPPPAETGDGGRPMPMPCLTPVRPQMQDGDAGKPPPVPPVPQPCLSPKPTPKPCLKVAPPGSR